MIWSDLKAAHVESNRAPVHCCIPAYCPTDTPLFFFLTGKTLHWPRLNVRGHVVGWGDPRRPMGKPLVWGPHGPPERVYCRSASAITIWRETRVCQGTGEVAAQITGFLRLFQNEIQALFNYIQGVFSSISSTLQLWHIIYLYTVPGYILYMHCTEYFTS